MAKYTPRIDHSKKDYESESEDIAQDKKIAKKAIGMHDKQQHEGEKTDLSKLKHGGRAKKEVGTVRKFKAGGAVDNINGKGGKSPGGKMGGLSAVPADKGAPHTAGVKKVAEKFNRGGKC